MPPDIVRPFATSNAGDIIALAHRLGMRWKDVRPDEGVMRAEGNGQSFTSTTVRGFGLLLQYTLDPVILEERAKTSNVLHALILPSREADMLGFQTISGDELFGLPDFVFDFDDPKGVDAITRAMHQLGIDREVRERYARYVMRSNNLHGFSDLLGMVGPFLPLEGSSVVQILPPCSEAHDSPTNWWEGFVVYHARLLRCMEEQRMAGTLSKQIEWVLERFEYMRRTYPWNECPSWEAESTNKEIKNGRSIKFLDDLRGIWSTTTSYFTALESDWRDLGASKRFRYIDLVGAHIAQAVHYPDLAESNIKAGHNSQRYDLGPSRSKRVAEGMHIYVDQIPEVVDFMKEKGFNVERVTQEAWWTLILRAMCWHRSIAFMQYQKGTQVSPSFYGSRIPVYIA